ncbi:hypothetical protein SDC9_192568 [bioreactor metagenome]|uniref:Uncharacterized protein n=1 Tax=bioreactor metagenome TaxID=1076179 RepID=A0A645I140_9ZZZZ
MIPQKTFAGDDVVKPMSSPVPNMIRHVENATKTKPIAKKGRNSFLLNCIWFRSYKIKSTKPIQPATICNIVMFPSDCVITIITIFLIYARKYKYFVIKNLKMTSNLICQNPSGSFHNGLFIRGNPMMAVKKKCIYCIFAFKNTQNTRCGKSSLPLG